MRIDRWVVVLGLLVGLGLSAGSVQAQEFGRVGGYEVQGVPYSVFTKIGEPTVQVYVVGSATSGLYEVGASTDLVRLFTFVGGPVPVNTPEMRQEVTVRLYRLEGDTRQVIYEAQAQELLTAPGAAPELRDGDVLVVETVQRQRFNWRDGLQILTSVSALVLLVDRLSTILR